jgi:5-(carboxyamino)imidazole ribonucleotide mutase
VATVAIGNAKNAGLLAVQILGAYEPRLQQQLQDYRQALQDLVLEKQALLEDVGYQAYLQEMGNNGV